MSVATFLALPRSATWHEAARTFLETLIKNRYGERGFNAISLRCPYFPLDDSVTFAGVLHKDSPSSGGYGGTSFVIFPTDGAGPLVALGVGTQGLSPDEGILTRPGHARLTKAFASWLRTHPPLATAWAKTDPTRIDIAMPSEVTAKYGNHERAVKRYGDVLYLTFDANSVSAELLEKAFVALLDLYLGERGIKPLTAHRRDGEALRTEYEGRVLQSPSVAEVAQLLDERRFVILQGPPGTGKTRLARELIEDRYKGRGRLIQFHPSIGYEQFVGGLAPIERDGEFGFAPTPGYLWSAATAAAATESKRPYLLVIDEINRADLARTLGEAIYLFEPNEPDREVHLAYDFGSPWHRLLRLPPNLHVLGTMNSADRSIAILDLAIRRRFAFMSLWPSAAALSKTDAIGREAFNELQRVFMAQASDEQLELLPGHAYFLSDTADEAKRRLRTELAPLLRDYVKQGLVAGFAEDIEGYLQWLDAKTAP